MYVIVARKNASNTGDINGRMNKNDMDTAKNWLDLASAVIACAADDYRLALQVLKKRKDLFDITISRAEDNKVAIEKFFSESFYMNFFDIDGEAIIEEIRKEEGFEKHANE